jgi:2,3-dihydroxybenzoate-AMP ligase
VLADCVPWPEEFRERYRRAGYWRGERLGDIPRDHARSTGAKIALVAGERRLTYAELDVRADRLAAGLHHLGIRRHDRVIIQLPNIPEFVLVSLALFRVGAIPVFALSAHRRHEIKYLVERSGSVAYIIPDRHQGFDYCTLARDVLADTPTVRHVIVVGEADEFTPFETLDDPPRAFEPTDPQDPAFFLLSGGTTGPPKLIPRTHDDYSYQLRATAEGLAFDARGVYLAALPAAHNAALGCPGVLGALKAGGTVVLATSPSPADVFPVIAREGVTLTTLITPLVLLWMDLADVIPVNLSGLLLQLGGATLDPEVGSRLRPKLGCALTQWFGMAEGLLCYTRLDDPDDVIVTTQGRPLSDGDELRVVDEQDREVPPGAVGQLLTRGPYTLRGYYREERYNAATFTEDGYLRTGDLVRLTPERRLVFEGRIKDVINRGGEKISPADLEEHLLAHPGIRDAVVVGIPDGMLGERTCAFVIAADGVLALPDVKRFLRARGLADYKLPDRLELVEAFPRTSIGKVNRTALRASAAPESAGRTTP